MPTFVGRRRPLPPFELSAVGRRVRQQKAAQQAVLDAEAASAAAFDDRLRHLIAERMPEPAPTVGVPAPAPSVALAEPMDELPAADPLPVKPTTTPRDRFEGQEAVDAALDAMNDADAERHQAWAATDAARAAWDAAPNDRELRAAYRAAERAQHRAQIVLRARDEIYREAYTALLAAE